MTAAHGPRTVAAVVVAGGAGQRLGADVPKAFVQIAGRTLLAHAAARLSAHPDIAQVVVVAPASHLEQAGTDTGLPVVAGGAMRQDSVAAGLAAVGDVEFVLVHDAARPFVPDVVTAAVIAALRDGADAVIPVVPVHDTVRVLGADGTLGAIVDRSTLAAVQTPQGFRRSVLLQAHAHAADSAATDDAGLVEALGYRVVAVPGSDDSFKITTPGDLIRAAALAGIGSDARPADERALP